MRIAVVTESFAPQTDPVADTSRHLVDGLIARGHDVLVVAPGPGQTSYRGARVVRARRLVPASAMSTTLGGFAPDLIHVASPRMLGALALRAASRLLVPALVVNQDALDTAAAQWWQTRVHPRSARTLVTCEDAGRRLTSVGIGAHLWRPGIDAEEFHPRLRHDQLHDRWARAQSPEGPLVVVGHVGSLDREKVVRRLTDIARLPRVRLVVIGAGAGADLLREAGAKVTGELTGLDLARGIASLDVLVQPRKKEMCVPGVRRALASGIPVGAFAAGGTPDVVRDGENGLLTRNDLTGSVARLVNDDRLRATLAASARTSVLGRSWQDAVDELVETHYSPVIGHRIQTAV
ncbi:MAG: glycosyl transferase, group 1 [Marmoricola sp.]|nr:glycosyl transferase, group 1 [Marmoricola sp.]